MVGFENNGPHVIEAWIVFLDATGEALFVDLAHGGAAPQRAERPQDQALPVQVHQLGDDLVLDLEVLGLRMPANEILDDLLQVERLIGPARNQSKPVFARIEVCAVDQVGRHEGQFSIRHRSLLPTRTR